MSDDENKVDIIVTVEGGLVQDVDIPEHLSNVEVVIRDYDTECVEEENLKEDETGDSYFEVRYGYKG